MDGVSLSFEVTRDDVIGLYGFHSRGVFDAGIGKFMERLLEAWELSDLVAVVEAGEVGEDSEEWFRLQSVELWSTMFEASEALKEFRARLSAIYDASPQGPVTLQ